MRCRTRGFLFLAMSCALVACGPQQPAVPAPSNYEPTPEERAIMLRLNEHQSAGTFDEGVAEAEVFLAGNPEARGLHYAIGVLHGMADRHDLARASFEEELSQDPGHLLSYRGAASAQIQLGRPDESIALLRRAHAIDPENADVLLELGRTLSNHGQLEDAALILQQAAERAGAPGQTEFGILLRRQGRLDEAAEAFRAALRQDPKELGAMVNLGQTLIALGRPSEGQALLRRHADQASLQDRLDVYRRSSRLEGATLANFLHLARLQIRARQNAEAVASYQRALELDPRSTAATLGLAALFRQDGQLGEATKWTVHTLLIDSTDDKAHFLLGMMRLTRDQIEPALAAFAASRRHAPWDAEGYWRVGDALRARGQLDLAAQHYRDALDQNASSVRAYFGLGFTQLLKSEVPAAIDSLRQAVALDTADAASLALLGIALDIAGETAAADETLGAAAAIHRLDLLTGQTADTVLAPFTRLPGAEATLVRYRGLLEAE